MAKEYEKFAILVLRHSFASGLHQGLTLVHILVVVFLEKVDFPGLLFPIYYRFV